MMRKYDKILSLALKSLQSTFILLWLYCLRKTDSYFVVYILWAIAGIYGTWSNKQKLNGFSMRETICGCTFSGIISFLVCLANYMLFITLAPVPRILAGISTIIGGFVCTKSIFFLILSRIPQEKLEKREFHAGRVFLSFFIGIFLIYLTYLLYAAYPAYLTPDSYESLRQISENNYINNNPFWYTMFIKLAQNVGLLFTTDPYMALGTYSIFQIVLLSLVFAYTLLTFYQVGLSYKWIASVFVLYGFSPYDLAFSATMWKDIVFAAAILLWITAMFRILRDVGSDVGNSIAFGLGCAGTCIMRTNGWYVVLVSAIFIFGILREKKYRKLLYIMAAILVVCWIFLNPVLSYMEVRDTDFVEGLALPFQQMARVVFNEYPLSETDRAMLDKIFDLDKIPEVFAHATVDPIKQTVFRQDQRQYLMEHAGEYIALWLRLGASHLSEYVKAWIELTKGYWNGGYPYEIYYLGESMPFNGVLDPAVYGNIKLGLHTYFDFLENFVLYQPFVSIGLHVWILLGCLFVNLSRKRHSIVLAIPVVVVVLGLWIGAPINAEFRYVYPMFVSLPVILAATLYTKEKV